MDATRISVLNNNWSFKKKKKYGELKTKGVEFLKMEVFFNLTIIKKGGSVLNTLFSKYCP